MGMNRNFRWVMLALMLMACVGMVLPVSAYTYIGNATHDGAVTMGVPSDPNSNYTWNALANGVGTSVGNSPESDSNINVKSNSSTSWSSNINSIITFDRSSIPAGSTITAVSVGVFGYYKSNILGTPYPALLIINATPTNYDSYVAGDYASTGFVELAPALPYSSFSTTGWNNFTFNAAGINMVNSTNGKFAIMFTQSNRTLNISPHATGGSQFEQMDWRPLGYSNNKPQITITYTNANVNGWNWSFGDNTTSTDQNPQHTYTTPGTYTVSLNATGPATVTAAFTTNTSSGTAPLTVQFTDGTTFGAGATVSNTTTRTITVTSPVTAPVAMFGPWPYIVGISPYAIILTDTSTNTPTSCLISWGDSAFWQNCYPSLVHSYVIPGVYPINMSVSNAAGTSYNQSVAFIY